ncbi:unnamed protein product, partial [Iphiclides podalirius]
MKSRFYSVWLLQERPPPLPPSRAYTVANGVKLGYPQQRVLAADWADESGALRLRAGDTVLALGAARRGHVAVQVPTPLLSDRAKTSASLLWTPNGIVRVTGL